MLFVELMFPPLTLYGGLEGTTMAETISDAAKRLATKINPMIEDFDNRGDQQVQALASELKVMLLRNNLIFTEVMHHSRVCTLPENRDGEMLIPAEAHTLLYLIALKKGWNDDECSLATTQELPPNSRGEQIQKENGLLAKSASGLLPPYKIDELRAAACIGSHTTAALRLADAADGKSYPVLEEWANPLGVEAIDHNGKPAMFLSRQRILETCPSLAEPVSKVIKYVHVRWQICEACPKLMSILSEADNCKHDTYRQVTTLQTLFNIHKKYIYLKPNTDEDVAKMCKQVARGRDPLFAASVPKYSDFVMKWSGGADKIFLLELDQWQKCLTTLREASPDFYRDLSKLKGADHAATYVIALLKALPSV